MNGAQETESTYDEYASKYEEKTKDYIEKYIQIDFDLFLRNLRGKKILDLGSGPGRDSILFKQRGFHPVCIDISKAMVELCKKKGLEAYEMGMEKLDFKNSSFDGVWAYASLLHLPKSKIRNVLKRIKDILKTEGIFYVGMKEGNSEGFEKRKHYPNHKRYFSLYTEEELNKLLLEFFDVFHFSRVETGNKHVFINFLCRKK